MNLCHSFNALIKYFIKKIWITLILLFVVISVIYFSKITQLNTPRYGLDFKLSYKVSKAIR